MELEAKTDSQELPPGHRASRLLTGGQSGTLNRAVYGQTRVEGEGILGGRLPSPFLSRERERERGRDSQEGLVHTSLKRVGILGVVGPHQPEAGWDPGSGRSTAA